MAMLNVYLNFEGKCEEAFTFYKSVFGGEFAMLSRFKDTPKDVQEEMKGSDGELIMHVALPIKGKSVLMGSDVPKHMGPVTTGLNVLVSIQADSKEEADKLFAGLSQGGKVTMPLSEAFWKAYFGMLTDKFGVNWMVNFDYNNSH